MSRGHADVASRISESRDELSPAERRVAEVVLREPEAAAFGTVATLATRAGTSGASVVRLATRLGFDGFSDLRAAVQASIGRQLRPAAERIRQRPAGDPVAQAAAIEVANVRSTLEAVDRDTFDTAVRLLADERRQVAVLAGDAEHGIGVMLTSALATLRPGVVQVSGSDVRAARELSALRARDVLVVIDLRRYERWVVAATASAAAMGAAIVAISDGPLSPLSAHAEVAFTVAADSAGPFDSHVGTLAVANALVAGVAGRRRATATRRLDRIEAAWRDADALVD
jgi:DNA-binding MurR/RpiR family transcriptional regulator